MKALLKTRALLLLGIGLLMMGLSPLWEYVRNRPDYRFVIRPWSMRGYEFTQGIVLSVGAALVLVLAVLLVLEVIKETPLQSALLGVGFVVIPVVIALATGARDVEVPFVGSAILSLVGMGVIGTLVNRFLPDDMSRAMRRLISVASRIVAFFVLLIFVLGPLLGGSAHPAWFVTLVAFGIVALISVMRPPEALAGWRIVINSILALWVIAITMGASLRADLAAAQFAVNDLSADLTDIQITSGVLIAWAGGLLAFTGGVALWARRRDEIAARDRARKQQQAARESEQQLAEQPA